LHIALDKAFENVFCIKAILRLPTKNRFPESTQRLIQPRPVRCDAATTHGRNEIKDFYELGEDCLWITFADGHLWWAFAHPEVQWMWDGTDDRPPRKRETLDGWHNTDIFGKPLRFAALSSKLTQVANFQGTICKVAGEDYLLRRINGIEEPVVVRANEARKVMMAVAVEMIRGLHWGDFERLCHVAKYSA
jgi:hypothetical protein